LVTKHDPVVSCPPFQTAAPDVTSERRSILIADEHFTAGQIHLAETLCTELWDEGVRSPMLTALSGEIQLLRNRPAAAEPLLRLAVDQQGGNPRLITSLAECLRRCDRLTEAADLYRSLGRIGFADKLRMLANGGQYLLPYIGAVTLPWATDAELPLVEVHVNGVSGHFLMDTGVGETLVDPALAREGKIETSGAETIHFPSGPAGQISHAIIDSLALGGFEIGRVPAQVHATREVFADLLPFPVDGILGTGLFSRLPTTLDYRERQLRLGNSERLTDGDPLYLASDQYPLVEARINDQTQTLLFLDTGMIGAAIALPFSTAEAADVEVARDIESAGFGVSGALRARPFLCQSLEAASARLTDLPGMLIGDFRLEHQFRFHIGGLLGDGFVNTGALTLDFRNRRVAVET
jgi:predicted aspartyl protease